MKTLTQRLLFTSIVTFFLLPTVSCVTQYSSDNEFQEEKFKSPSKEFYPETWFHYIGGNISKEGITADLEAIAKVGISGVQLFHGQFGGEWPEVAEQIQCLSEKWDEHVEWTALECKRLGLKFTMQNCPGWAYAGGPWITSENAMRELVYTRTDIKGGDNIQVSLPSNPYTDIDWRDYHDLFVIAFPTAEGDNQVPLKIKSCKSNNPEIDWNALLIKKNRITVPASGSQPHQLEIELEEPGTLRTLLLPSIESLSHQWCYVPGVHVKVFAIDSTEKLISDVDLPQSNWQDPTRSMTIACSESYTNRYRIEIENKHSISLSSLELFSAARKQNWEAEAGYTLRSILRNPHPEQKKESWVNHKQIIRLSFEQFSKATAQLSLPEGDWTLLRIGHVNTGAKNGPAPKSGTGWECNKLSKEGARTSFSGYIGRLTDKSGVLKDGKLNGLLLDSWECKTQTWTSGLDSLFDKQWGYQLADYLPALFGYVVDDPETTYLFLRDWRVLLNNLLNENFFGEIHSLAKERELTLSFETASGDIFPGDIMEYYKYADIPMCEFWHPREENFVGSLDFKPVKPCVSAARMYGKKRVAAEAFTSFQLTWDEHPGMLKPIADFHLAEGISHLVFHTYTHNPQLNFRPPGTSMGSTIGTPFLRNQTWWNEMKGFTDYLARCNYMLEQGNPVSDVLMYLGDEQDHKPSQLISFPSGYKYDYCNRDALLNRIEAKDGKLITPEGLNYRVLWLYNCERLQPETIERIADFAKKGVIIVGDKPIGPASLSEKETTQQAFETAVNSLWGTSNGSSAKIYPLNSDFTALLGNEKILPDITCQTPLYWNHRTSINTDSYFLTAPVENDVRCPVKFRSTQQYVELWNPLTGAITEAPVLSKETDGYTLNIDLKAEESVFVIFTDKSSKTKSKAITQTESINLSEPWSIHFPENWNVTPQSMKLDKLQPWCVLPIGEEGKHFSGTATYETDINLNSINKEMRYQLDIGQVNYIAKIWINGEPVSTLWSKPYITEITPYLHEGVNHIKIDVTSSWFNRLVYDAALPQTEQKTWTISGPTSDQPLRNYGLLGPVKLIVGKDAVSTKP